MEKSEAHVYRGKHLILAHLMVNYCDDSMTFVSPSCSVNNLLQTAFPLPPSGNFSSNFTAMFFVLSSTVVLLLNVHGQQVWSCRDGQLT